MSLRLSLLRLTLGLITFSGILSSRAIAAEQVVLKYHILQTSIPVKDLTNFTETGQLSSMLQTYLNVGRQDPKAVRQYLTTPVRVDPVTLDRLLNSQIGDLLLDKVSQTVHTPSGQANRQALRSALILSAKSDGKITLIKTIQNYPTPEVQVEGDRLESAYRQLRRLGGGLKNIIGY